MRNPEFGAALPQRTGTSLKRALLGEAKDLRDPSIHHKLSLVAFLAWVGLGADGLSSSAYGPEEAYKALGQHTYLALLLVLATAITVFVISFSYSKIIERFPQGGGGYLVATELLGETVGVISGCALLVDYVLTITVSIAGGGDAIFSLLPLSMHVLKRPVEFFAIVALIVLNLRGIKESITILVPIFMTFVVTHALLIGGGVISHLFELPHLTHTVTSGFQSGASEVGAFGLFLIFLRAYSIGGGTYTGIEAVSNAVGALREPKVETGKRTMLYMAISLATTAGGLLLCYMLIHAEPVEGQTLNAVLADKLAGNVRPLGIPIGHWFVLITIASEAFLLLVAAQAGFIDGPRVMANMALDNWLPRRFGALSDRLTMQNGILLIGGAALLLLLYTGGDIRVLVVMYSINVFVTFTLSQTAMIRLWYSERKFAADWKKNISIHAVGFVLCVSILAIMAIEKFTQGAWVTILITLTCITLCFAIRRHYRRVVETIVELRDSLDDLPELIEEGAASPAWLDRAEGIKQTAVILVSGYDGLGVHLFLNILRNFPKTFDQVVFISVGVIDTAFFRNTNHIAAVDERTRQALERYVGLARKLGLKSELAYRIGTDVVGEASELCIETARTHPRCIFFAGELLFEKPSWYQRILHNETAYAIQRRIRFAGLSMAIMPLILHTQSRSLEAIKTAANR